MLKNISKYLDIKNIHFVLKNISKYLDFGFLYYPNILLC